MCSVYSYFAFHYWQSAEWVVVLWTSCLNRWWYSSSAQISVNRFHWVQIGKMLFVAHVLLYISNFNQNVFAVYVNVSPFIDRWLLGFLLERFHMPWWWWTWWWWWWCGGHSCDTVSNETRHEYSAMGTTERREFVHQYQLQCHYLSVHEQGKWDE